MKSWGNPVRNYLARGSARRALLKKAQPYRLGKSRPRVRRLSQEIVNRILFEEVLPLRGAFAEQEGVRTELSRASSPERKEILTDLLGRYEEAIEKVKSRFWEVHRKAKTAGFKVKPSFEDYLPSF